MSKIVSGIKSDQLYPITQTKLVSPDILYNFGIQSSTINSSSSTTYSTPVASLYIEDVPIAGTNVTIISPAYSLYIPSGNCYFGEALDINVGRITNYIAPNANRFSQSMELQYSTSTNTGIIAPFNRSSSTYTTLYLHNTIYITGAGGANGTGYVGINKTTPAYQLDVTGLLQSQSFVVTGVAVPTSGSGLELYYSTFDSTGRITCFTRPSGPYLNVMLNECFYILSNQYVQITPTSLVINTLYFGRFTVPGNGGSYGDYTITHNLNITFDIVVVQMQTGATTNPDILFVCVTSIAANSFTVKVGRVDATGWGGPHYVNWIGIKKL